MNEGTESSKFISNFNKWTPPKPISFGHSASAGVAKTQNDEAIDISALLSTTPAEDVGFNKGITLAGICMSLDFFLLFIFAFNHRW